VAVGVLVARAYQRRADFPRSVVVRSLQCPRGGRGGLYDSGH
jgi:hypothetical protein